MDNTSEVKELKKFGFTFSIVFSIWWCFFYFRGKPAHVYFIALVSFFSLVAIFAPYFLSPIKKGWMAITICINWLVKFIVLNCLFFLVITPTALLAKVCGRKFLDLTFQDGKNSYWIPRKKSTPEKSSYVSQF